MRKVFHFTIGPVQDFVARSRRTRDLLASSFLLSFLSGHAMVELIRQGGQIRFPYVQNDEGHLDPLLDAIYKTVTHEPVETQPWIGSIPNRFIAEIDSAHFDPQTVIATVEMAWRKVANAVKDYALSQDIIQLGRKSVKIWERQVRDFWEITWVMGEDANLLDRRKNWRSHIPPEEPRDKCLLMSQLQELSGYHRISERRAQDRFWTTLREKIGAFHLNDHERLSAIGLIKRLYPLVSEKALGWKWPSSAISFPSTGYLAALPWMVRAMKEHPHAAKTFASAAKQHQLQTVSISQHFPAIQSITKQQPSLRSFTNLDGKYVYPESFALETAHLTNEAQCKLQMELTQLTKVMKGEPADYYALLMMDGDRLGQLLQTKSKEPNQSKKISEALALFTDQIAKQINDFHGVTIYAGGDDVLALFPLAQAIPAAVHLREKYIQSFQQSGSQLQSTISAGIVYAHKMAPLQNIVQYGHYLLDRIAKEKSGRDSLAIGTWKGSGPDLIWSARWEEVYDPARPSAPTHLEQLAADLQSNEILLSNSFLYKLRELYENGPMFSEDPQENKEIIIQLLVADYIRIVGWNNKINRDQIEQQMASLVNVCCRNWNPDSTINHSFKADGALVAAFLAQKGAYIHA
ncbi:CRISPR-associated protein, Cmr2 family [Seinonella peptonophila]|uniref:CRISPR-associated protein, Cmr2 family n=1 Tax=Seinonella peptonophila TaxID=112248 RepID=A0A1M5A1B6_9BACL|nr:type III-B CRISPR-associated protein Cas10/Cmr2 [Seinonella peptonophila]SHF24015.1 CRISPR-associated protein, Cmr2 family [Seinonella peptonophila]